MNKDTIKIGKITIFKRSGSTSYQARWFECGKVKTKSLMTVCQEQAIQIAIAIGNEVEQQDGLDMWVPETIEDGIQEFLDHHKSNGRAPGTIARYRVVLIRFMKYCHDIKLKDLSRLHGRVLDKYYQSRHGDCAEKSRYFEAITVKSFGKYMARIKAVRVNPFLDEMFKKPIQIEPDYFSLTQVNDIIVHAVEMKYQLRRLYLSSLPSLACA